VTPQTKIVSRIDPRAVVVGPVSIPTQPPIGRAFIDLSETARATVYVVDASWQRILIRHVPRSANPEVLRETLARIVSTGVEALLSGSFADLSRPLDRPQAPRKAQLRKQADAEPKHAMRGGVMYESALLSSERLVTHGPGLMGSLAFSSKRRVRWGLWLTAQYRLPISVTETPLGLRLNTLALRLLLGIEHDLSRGVTLESGIGPGLDVNHLSPHRTSEGEARLAAERWFGVGLGRALLGLRMRMFDGFWLRSALVADLDPTQTKYIYDLDGERQTLMTPYMLRPGMLLAFGLH
jgi:hypothetical protein